MALIGKKDAAILFLGDSILFIAALWLALFSRYGEVPAVENLLNHIIAFLPVFLLWAIVFFIFGLYDKQTTAFKSKLPDSILSVSILNGIIALVFFYLFPYQSMTPKTNLLLCLVFSVALIYFWRMFVFDRFRTAKIGNVLIVGEAREIAEMRNEFTRNRIYGINPMWASSFNDGILGRIIDGKVRAVIVDTGSILNTKDSLVVSKILFSGVNLMSAEDIYESLFEKVPLSFLDNKWFLENHPNDPRFIYDILKRAMDIIVSVPLALFSLIFYPFVFIAIKIDDRGPVFIAQERAGRNGKPIKIVKFRSMSTNDAGKWVTKNDPRITRVGNFLRKSRIDELPQLWNVIKGDISLIGPRPELPKFVDIYEKEIPYYNMRHLIKPGLSGWAQIHHEKPPQSVEETKEKLAYDLYYVKNRSIMLDLEIALKTIKTLLSRTGM